jgi:hypothetical protein
VVAVLLYLHSSVLGGIAISSFWSLLNERFDPHTAKPLLARVAGAATFGGLLGGLSAERVAALLPEGALLPLLGLVSAGCVAGVLVGGKGAPAHPPPAEDSGTRAGAWGELRRQPLLRNLAIVTALAQHRRLYGFLAARRERAFAARAAAVHLLYHVYNGVSFVIGMGSHWWDVVRRRGHTQPAATCRDARRETP